jgi:hypothetical protein
MLAPLFSSALIFCGVLSHNAHQLNTIGNIQGHKLLPFLLALEKAHLENGLIAGLGQNSIPVGRRLKGCPLHHLSAAPV